MNKTLRQSYKANSWSYSNGFIEYLRAENCFQGISGQPNANPYWYGSTLDFNRIESVIKGLIQSKSIKTSRLKAYAEDYANDYLSPIVKLTGFVLLRLAK
jgi:hypothetical protein